MRLAADTIFTYLMILEAGEDTEFTPEGVSNATTKVGDDVEQPVRIREGLVHLKLGSGTYIRLYESKRNGLRANSVLKIA